jgi:dTDP-4-dehydrorhamnose 3,5-epimerase
LKIEDTSLPGVKIVCPEAIRDDRGWFMEMFTRNLLHELGQYRPFDVFNSSSSHHLVVRGLHWQNPLQAKLIRVISGEILDAVVDVRIGSSTFGRYALVHLSDSYERMLYVPAGFAHGFLTLSYRETRIEYNCDAPYAPQGQRGIIWNDTDLNIPWKTLRPRLSAKDAALPLLRNIPQDDLPRL